MQKNACTMQAGMPKCR
jgi:hypothetical protein